eukprot:10431567-Alexandrium_andersonii.AAC.1
MSASLVGSEMCIRDRPGEPCVFAVRDCSGGRGGGGVQLLLPATRSPRSVSYTHLTLPTIA